MTDRQPFSPNWISPPGDTIEDLLDERGWTQAELAKRVNYTKKHINELVRGHKPITPEAAERLSLVLGSTTDFWLVREAQYRAALAEQEAIEHAKQHADWLKELPLAWMRKQGWVHQTRNSGRQVLEALRFFGVATVDAWETRYKAPVTAFRASERFDKKVGAVAAWLRQGETQATSTFCAPFHSSTFRSALQEIRTLTTEGDPTVFVPALQKACAEAGVAVAFVPAPPGCPASGATQWLTPHKAMLILSLRHKSNDHLWFTFFHEAAHLLLHSKKMMFIDGLDGLDPELEAEADAFAQNLLIPPKFARQLRTLTRSRHPSKAEVRAVARRAGVAPGILVGRMQKEGWLKWSHMNDLKVRYEWA